MGLKDIVEDIGGALEKNPGIQTGLRGAALGAGAYSVVALVKEVEDMLKDRKKRKDRENPKISDKTIVLTVPGAKVASARDSFIVDGDDVEEDETEENKMKLRQARNKDGTFASGWEFSPQNNGYKCAGAGDEKPPREPYQPGFFEGAGDTALGIALGVGGVGLGWHGVEKLHDYLRKKRLKREIAAAQQEYIDFLMDDAGLTSKTAEEVDLADIKPEKGPGVAKTVADGIRTVVPGTGSGNDTVDAAQGTLGAVGGLSLLIMAASSYITKKFLDKKFNDAYNAKTLDDSPKVDNIVVKTAEAGSIKMTPVDALAFVKFASILIEADSDWNEYENASNQVEKNASMEKDAVLPLLPLIALGLGGTALVGGAGYAGYRRSPRAARKWSENAKPHEIIDTTFNSIGMSGDDPSKWTYDPSNKRELTEQQMKQLRAAAPGIRGRRDELLKEFMSDRYRPQREYLAQKTIDDWYDRNIRSIDFLHNNFGQWLKPIVSWFGNMFANTGWGKTRMFNTMYNGMMDRVTPKGAPPAGTPPAETPPAGTPPSDTPPAVTPPAETPPAVTPPAPKTPPATGVGPVNPQDPLHPLGR